MARSPSATNIASTSKMPCAASMKGASASRPAPLTAPRTPRYRSLHRRRGGEMAKPKRASKSKTKAAVSKGHVQLAQGPDELLTRLPAIDDPHRKAFTGQFTNIECTTLGAQTKSAAVRAGAFSWAAEAQPALSNSSIAD